MTLNTLIKTAAAGVVALAIAAPAKADWGGLYIGASVGWAGLNDIDWQYANGNPNTQNPGDADNLIVGGHIGFQHQWGQVVVGLEASYTGLTAGSDAGQGICPNPAFSCDVYMRTMFTVGPRLGWAPNNQWMIYVTGGYAAAWLNAETKVIATGVIESNESNRHEGWFIGAGFDWNIHGNWILGLEYKHVSLDSAVYSPNTGIERSVEADIDIVQVRLSYKWGRPEAAPLK